MTGLAQGAIVVTNRLRTGTGRCCRSTPGAPGTTAGSKMTAPSPFSVSTRTASTRSSPSRVVERWQGSLAYCCSQCWS